MKVTRRRFIRASMSALAGATLLGLSPGRVRAAGSNLVREFNFSAMPTLVSLGSGPNFSAFTYNGHLPGPEIRVKEGETIRVVLNNEMDLPTTIHWHGIPLPNAMDGVPGLTQKAVAPGGTFVYEFEARPAGTYIYHSHQGYQLDQGLYGALIIEPVRSERSYDREYTLLLEDWVIGDGAGPAATRRLQPSRMMMGGMMGRRRMGGSLWEPHYDTYAVNGKAYPAVEPVRVTKGDRVKLRLINVSSATIYDLRLAGHSLTITHTDGNPVQPMETDVLRIGMGERYDVEFTADNPGRWIMGAYENGLGESKLKVPVLYKGINSGQPKPPTFPRGLRYVRYWDLASPGMSSNNGDSFSRRYRQSLSGGMHSGYWTINGRVHPNSETLPISKGDVVRLGYFNHSMMPHPMHLHGHFFRVVNPGLSPEQWIKKDTVIVDPMQSMEIEFKADNPGRWFHHCHHLYHAEAGMANVLAYTS